MYNVFFIISTHFGHIVGRIKKYCRIFGRTQRFAPKSNAGLRAIVGANLVFARSRNPKMRIVSLN